MNYDTYLPESVLTLTDNIIYDDDLKEVIVRIGRMHIGFTVDEFAIISKEIEEASNLMHKVLLNKVQENNSEEIN